MSTGTDSVTSCGASHDDAARRRIGELRTKRGREQVTFADIADHLEDHLRRCPTDAAAIDRLAGFLAGVEDVPHEHDGDGATLEGGRRDVSG